MLNTVCTAINLVVVALVVIVGLTQIDIHNWNISPNEVDENFEKFLFRNFVFVFII
jgi:hypothetical protein